MFTKSDEQRRKQILSGFIQKGCGGSYGTEEKQPVAEEKSPAEQEKEKEQNKKQPTLKICNKIRNQK